MVESLLWRPDEPCPCNSGKHHGNCCLQSDGTLRKQVPLLTPPPPRTGFAQPGCYLASTKDCSEGLSKEHYMSEAVLEVLPGGVEISGMPWLSPGEARKVSIASLTARILCRRHNSALAPLDQEAGAFFRALREIDIEFTRKTLSRRGPKFLFSGELIERWMLKVTAGFFFGRIAERGGTRLVDDHKFDVKKMEAALLRGSWDRGGGIYLNATQNTPIRSHDTISFTPATYDSDRRLVGGRLLIRGGQTYDVLFDLYGIASPAKAAGWHWRPSRFTFSNGTRKQFVVLTWPAGTPPAPIGLDVQRILKRPRV
jgi:hypothetical protein